MYMTTEHRWTTHSVRPGRPPRPGVNGSSAGVKYYPTAFVASQSADVWCEWLLLSCERLSDGVHRVPERRCVV